MTCAQKRVPSLRTRQPSASNLPVRSEVCSAVAGTPRAMSSSAERHRDVIPVLPVDLGAPRMALTAHFAHEFAQARNKIFR
jgi:hypothetical protein